MAASRYTPNRGDVVWLKLTPQTGHEQADHRTALVLSPAAYYSKTGLMVCRPITSRVKRYPFEVSISTSNIKGVVLADQVKSLDWQARKATKKIKAPRKVLEETLGRLGALLWSE